MTYIGTKLRYLRKQDNVTQQQLADAIGVAKSTISMYENGQREPDFETLESLADYFNVEMRTFFPGNSIPSQSESAPSVNVVKIAGRDGRYLERRLSDAQLNALMAMVEQLPDAEDL